MTKDHCCICFDNIVNTSLQCSHEFCQKCITEVINHHDDNSLVCPLCRNSTYITSNEDINHRIFDIEINRNKYGDYYDWDKIIRDYVNNLNLFNGEDFNVVRAFYDIRIGAKTFEIKSHWQSFYVSSIKLGRWTGQWYNPRWNWPAYKMSDYYKLYNTPQITA